MSESFHFSPTATSLYDDEWMML